MCEIQVYCLLCHKANKFLSIPQLEITVSSTFDLDPNLTQLSDSQTTLSFYHPSSYIRWLKNS